MMYANLSQHRVILNFGLAKRRAIVCNKYQLSWNKSINEMSATSDVDQIYKLVLKKTD